MIELNMEELKQLLQPRLFIGIQLPITLMVQ